jgi:hypothetical protein
MMQPANPIDFGGAVTPATRAKHAPQLDPPATRTVSEPQAMSHKIELQCTNHDIIQPRS